MTLRALTAACWLLAALAACTSGPGTESPSVSTGGDGDGDGRDQDASSEEQMPGLENPDGAHADGGAQDAGQDAAEPDPEAPTTDGVHVSVAGEPYQTATDVFYFEAGGRPGIQGDFAEASLRVELGDTPGTLSCKDGTAAITYETEGGQLRASGELGSCTIELESFGSSPGDPITATVRAIVERTTGEAADSLPLTARIQVGHP